MKFNTQNGAAASKNGHAGGNRLEDLLKADLSATKSPTPGKEGNKPPSTDSQVSQVSQVPTGGVGQGQASRIFIKGVPADGVVGQTVAFLGAYVVMPQRN